MLNQIIPFMKKFFLSCFVALATFACSSDDDNSETEIPDMSEEFAVVRIAQVDAENDQVTLINLGVSSVDAGSYWLCLGPGTYRQVSDIASGDTVLDVNETLTVSYDVNPDADGLGVFSDNQFSSSDPEILIDYVQWGAGDQARVEQAVAAGRWDDSDLYVQGVDVFVFNGEATEFGSTFWSGNTEMEIDGVLRILTVRPMADEIVLSNLGDTNIDAGSYWLCLGPGTYRQISDIATSSTMLGADETLTVSYDVNPDADGLGVFSDNQFSSSNPEILIDYVQWGAVDQARVEQAVAAGRWDDVSNFVETAEIIEFTGGATDFGSTFW